MKEYATMTFNGGINMTPMNYSFSHQTVGLPPSSHLGLRAFLEQGWKVAVVFIDPHPNGANAGWQTPSYHFVLERDFHT